jgi:predicted nucleotidyltransferase
VADDPKASSALQLLHQVGQFLDTEGVGWAAIGALAVSYHGVVRASLDADALITLKGSALDLDQLAEKLRLKGWKVDARMGEPGDPLGFVVRINDQAENQVDLIGGIRRLDAGFFERSSSTELDGMALKIASPEDLVALKVFAGGPMDLEDAKGVLEIAGTRIDADLLRRLCRQFGPSQAQLCEKLLKSDKDST